MASYIEVKVGARVYRHVFEETDAVVGAALGRFAGTIEPPLPKDATADQRLEDAVGKIIRSVSRTSQRVRLTELQATQIADLEKQAQTEGSLKHKEAAQI